MKVQVNYNQSTPKKHSVRFSTLQVDPDTGFPYSDVYIPKTVLRRIQWKEGDSVYVTYSSQPSM